MRGFLVVAAAKLWKMQSKMMHQNGFSPAIGITHDRKKVKGLLSWYMAWLLGFVLLCLDNFRKCKARSKKKPLVLLLVADASRARQGGFGSSRWKRKQQGKVGKISEGWLCNCFWWLLLELVLTEKKMIKFLFAYAVLWLGHVLPLWSFLLTGFEMQSKMSFLSEWGWFVLVG